MRVYLDNCCYNRPFDNQNQLRVYLESVAKLEIQSLMGSGDLEYAWSDMLDGEIADNPSIEKRRKILPWRNGAAVRIHITPEIEQRAQSLMKVGIKSADALHLVCAECADCDWFLTVDKGILSKVRNVGAMRVGNPLAYVQEVM